MVLPLPVHLYLSGVNAAAMATPVPLSVLPPTSASAIATGGHSASSGAGPSCGYRYCGFMEYWSSDSHRVAYLCTYFYFALYILTLSTYLPLFYFRLWRKYGSKVVYTYFICILSQNGTTLQQSWNHLYYQMWSYLEHSSCYMVL